MRTTITSAMTGKAVTFDGNVQGRVGIRLSDGPGAILERVEVLDALREALAVTIIDGPIQPLADWERELMLATAEVDLSAAYAQSLAEHFAALAAAKRAVENEADARRSAPVALPPITPGREVLAGEVVEGDVIMTEHGPRPVQSVVRQNGRVHLYYRKPGGLDWITRPSDSLLAIRDAVVVVPAPKPAEPSHEQMLAVVQSAGWCTVPDDQQIVAHQYARLVEAGS